MRAPTLAATAIAASMILAMAPMTAETTTADGTPAASCGDTAGREMLGADGLSLSVAAPAVTAPELAASAGVTGEAITPHRTIHYYFAIDMARYAESDLAVSVSWPDLSADYDLYAYTYTDGYRYGLATSNASNIDGGDTRSEQFTTKVTDCQLVDIEIRAWAGNPAQKLELELELTPKGEAIEGVADRPADSRLSLFLAGDRPGNATTPADTAGAEYPLGATFSSERPTSNVPNLITRPVAGSTIEKNPVQPWWSGELSTFPTITGKPSAVVFLSSASQQQDPGAVLVQLFLNGAEQTVVIPGSELTPDVRPFIVEFDAYDGPVFTATLQVAALPIASPNTASEHLGDANHTVWYDSVQYPSRLFLPVAQG